MTNLLLAMVAGIVPVLAWCAPLLGLAVAGDILETEDRARFDYTVTPVTIEAGSFDEWALIVAARDTEVAA